MLTRRQTLQAAAAFSLSACRSNDQPTITGGYTNESQARGHWLRDATALPVASTSTRTGYIIAGGGVIGCMGFKIGGTR